MTGISHRKDSSGSWVGVRDLMKRCFFSVDSTADASSRGRRLYRRLESLDHSTLAKRCISALACYVDDQHGHLIVPRSRYSVLIPQFRASIPLKT
jgi:hypothetical protein